MIGIKKPSGSDDFFVMVGATGLPSVIPLGGIPKQNHRSLRSHGGFFFPRF